MCHCCSLGHTVEAAAPVCSNIAVTSQLIAQRDPNFTLQQWRLNTNKRRYRFAGSHLRIDFWESYSCLGFCYFIIDHCDRKTNHLVLLAFRSAAVCSLWGLRRHRGDIDATSAKWKEEPWNAIKLLWLEAAKAAHSKIICNNKNR